MSLQLFLMDKVMRVSGKRRFRKQPDIMTLRTLMEELVKRGTPVPPSVKIDTIALGGVPTEKLSTGDADDTKAILYIHGGGFVGGVPANHRALTWRLAAQTKIPVYVVDYRLAPEHPFPASLDDCIAAYLALVNETGVAPGRIAIGGDSAGGNLTLAVALKLKQDGVPLPACLVALSPIVDLAAPSPSHATNARADALFDPRIFDSVAPAYCGTHDPADPLVSPLRGDVHGLPPTLFQCSRDEMLRDDSIRMAEKMQAAGVAVDLEVWPKVFHVWHLTADIVPEARRAIEKIARFIATHIPN